MAVATVRLEIANWPQIEHVIFACFDDAMLEMYQRELAKEATE